MQWTTVSEFPPRISPACEERLANYVVDVEWLPLYAVGVLIEIQPWIVRGVYSPASNLKTLALQMPLSPIKGPAIPYQSISRYTKYPQ